MATTYCEPTVLWHLSHPDEGRAKLVIVPHWDNAIIVQYTNDAVVNCEQFSTIDDAVTRAGAIHSALGSAGWCVPCA